jgi:hypothetical protein
MEFFPFRFSAFRQTRVFAAAETDNFFGTAVALP